MEVKSNHKCMCQSGKQQGWRDCDISDLCLLQRGFDITEATRNQGSIPVYSSSGLSYFHNESKLQPPAVITGRKGILGKVFFVEEACWPHDTTLWVKDFKGNDPRFVSIFLSQFRLERFDAATSVPTLNRNNLVGIPIRLPPLSEQRAIATALSDVDVLFGALDRLIAKKRDIKQAVMQELLTGQTRLPGFTPAKQQFKQTDVGPIPEDWRVEKVGEISTVGRGRVISHREIALAKSPLYPVYSSQTSDNGIMGYLDTFQFEGEYITWTTDGANAGTVFHRNGRFNCTNVCGTIRLKQDSAGFVSRVLARITSPYVSRNLGNPKLMNDVMKQIPVPLPPSLPEQTAIAEVLSDMDAELGALEQRREKTRALKQGMMQELLTGRTRLV